MTLPTKALSVRQPWAWAIIHAGKDIENRSWQAVNYGLKVRGRIAIHASKGITQREYQEAAEFMASIGVTCPPSAELIRGGIIGSVHVDDVVTESDSLWFFGPRGLVLSEPRACEPIPSVGALGYFNWKQASDEHLPQAYKWMTGEPRAKPINKTGLLL